jgi:hypothetical protein
MMRAIIFATLFVFFPLVRANWWSAVKSRMHHAVDEAESSVGDILTAAESKATGIDMSDTCAFTRLDALQCIAVYVDANHDKEISPYEFERAKHLYLPAQMRAAAWAAKKLGYDVTLASVLWGCDANHDGRLTLSDWEASRATCLPRQADLCKMKSVCDYAQQMEAKPARV